MRLAILVLASSVPILGAVLDSRQRGHSYWAMDYLTTNQSLGMMPMSAALVCPHSSTSHLVTPSMVAWQLARQFGTQSGVVLGPIMHYLIHSQQYESAAALGDSLVTLKELQRAAVSAPRLELHRASPAIMRQLCAKRRNNRLALRPIEVWRGDSSAGQVVLRHDDASMPLPRECPWLSAVVTRATSSGKLSSTNWIPSHVEASWEPSWILAAPRSQQPLMMASLPAATGTDGSLAPNSTYQYQAPSRLLDLVQSQARRTEPFAFDMVTRPQGAFAWEWLPADQARRYLAAVQEQVQGAAATPHSSDGSGNSLDIMSLHELGQRLARLCEGMGALHDRTRLDPAACVRLQVGLTHADMPGDSPPLPLAVAARVLPPSAGDTRWSRGNGMGSGRSRGRMRWSVERPMQHATRAVASVCLGRVVHPDDVVLGKRPGTMLSFEGGRAAPLDPATQLAPLVLGPSEQGSEAALHGSARNRHGLGSPFSAVHQSLELAVSGTAAQRSLAVPKPAPPVDVMYGLIPHRDTHHVPGQLTQQPLTAQERCVQSAQLLWDGPDAQTVALLRRGLLSFHHGEHRHIGRDSGGEVDASQQLEAGARALGRTGWSGLSPSCDDAAVGQWRGQEWKAGLEGAQAVTLAQLSNMAALPPREMLRQCRRDGAAVFDQLKLQFGVEVDKLEVTADTVASSLCMWMHTCEYEDGHRCPGGLVPAPMPFLSQQVMQQDLWVVQIAMQGKRGGYFVEAGAVDGRMLSTTWALERGFGWRGLLVEARGEELEAMRLRRPRSSCVHAALAGSDGGYLDMSAATDDTTGMMAVAGPMGVPGGTGDAAWAGRGRAPIRRLSTILDEVGAPSRIDFLTLDIEGGELEVLGSFPFDRYSFGAMSIETNNEEPRRSQIRGVLASHGYVYAGGLGLDDAYLHPDVAADALEKLDERARRRRGRGRRVGFGGTDLGS